MDKRNKEEMNRREFLKIVGVSAAASTAVMYGCASGEKRRRQRLPYKAKCLLTR